MAVVVRAPARLHLGFIPSFRDGDRPGSAAVSISPPYLELRISPSEDVHVSGPLSDEFFSMAVRFLERFAPGRGVDIEVLNSISRHAGFGSGTRMAFAIGMGISELYGLDVSYEEIAEFFGRGRNSRAGIVSLMKGGFAVVHPDGRISNIQAPEGWSFVVAVPEVSHDFHGDEEKKAMGSLSYGTVEDDLASMLKDAVSSGNISEAGTLLERIDLETGKMFSKSQDGDYSHGIVSGIIAAGKEAGAYGAGQSSWGPAVYFLVDEGVEDRVISSVRGAMDSGYVEKVDISGTGISVQKE